MNEYKQKLEWAMEAEQVKKVCPLPRHGDDHTNVHWTQCDEAACAWWAMRWWRMFPTQMSGRKRPTWTSRNPSKTGRWRRQRSIVSDSLVVLQDADYT